MFSERIKKIQAQLKAHRLQAALISSVANITYLTGFNFALEEREGYILMTSKSAYLLTNSIYSTILREKLPDFEVVEISRRDPSREILLKLLGKKSNLRLGIEEDDLTVAEYKSLQKKFKNLINFEPKLSRTIKDLSEIDLIKKACEIGDLAFLYILKKIKPGITEKELGFELDIFIKENADDVSFSTIIAFARNAAAPHHKTGETILGEKQGQVILMDFGVRFKNYCSDMTRTFFWGQPSVEGKRLYQAVLRSQERSEEYIKLQLKKGLPVKCAKVDQEARDYLVAEGYPKIPHSVGHGIGVEVHEHPYLYSKSKEELKEGMVFSIEPGIYLPDKMGVRIEDLYAIQNGRLIRLTKSDNSLMVF